MEKRDCSILNILLWIPLLLLILPGAGILFVWQMFFESLVTKVLKRSFRPLNDMMDMTMCQGNSFELPNTNAAQVWILSGSWVTQEEFSSHFHTCFIEGNPEKYRNLYAHVRTYGSYSFYAHCKPEHLDLKWHIREYSIKDFGSGTVESFAAKFLTTNTYEENRPVWQIALLHLGSRDGLDCQTAIVAKFSHQLIDGYSFVHMIGKLTDNPAPYIVKERSFNWKEKLKYVFTAPKDIFSIYGRMAFSSDSQSPFKKVARCSTLNWEMSFATLDLATVKLLRKATEAHFICLMISAQFGALRRLLLETMREDELPEYLWIGSSLAWPNHPLKLTNHWTMGYFKCPLRLADPLQRLKYVEENYREFKDVEYDVKGMFSIMPLLRILPTWARRLFCHYDFALYNVSLFFASLLLSSKKHYLLGRPVKHLYLPLACSDVIPVALYGVTTSHSGQIDFAISACNAIVKSGEELDRLTRIYFIEELDSIGAQCGLSCSAAMKTQ